jgi:hypothetical protein
MHTFRDRVHAHARSKPKACMGVQGGVHAFARPEKLTPTDCCQACKTVQTRPLQRLPQGTLREKH